jgi:hypothetical protein
LLALFILPEIETSTISIQNSRDTAFNNLLVEIKILLRRAPTRQTLKYGQGIPQSFGRNHMMSGKSTIIKIWVHD